MCSFFISLAVSIQMEEQIVSQLPEDVDEFSFPSPHMKDLIQKIPLLLEIIRNTVEVEFNSQDCRTIDIADMFQIVINEEKNIYGDQIGFNNNTMSIINQKSPNYSSQYNDEMCQFKSQHGFEQSQVQQNPFGDQKYWENNKYSGNHKRPFSSASTCNNFVFKRPNSTYSGMNPMKQQKLVGKTNIWQVRPHSSMAGHQTKFQSGRSSIRTNSIIDANMIKENKLNFIDTAAANERSHIKSHLENSQKSVYHDKNGFRLSQPSHSRKQSAPNQKGSRNFSGSSSTIVNINNNQKSNKKRYSNENSNSKYGIAAVIKNSLSNDFDGEMFLTTDCKGIGQILKNE